MLRYVNNEEMRVVNPVEIFFIYFSFACCVRMWVDKYNDDRKWAITIMIMCGMMGLFSSWCSQEIQKMEISRAIELALRRDSVYERPHLRGLPPMKFPADLFPGDRA
jgi:hypothetical protein